MNEMISITPGRYRHFKGKEYSVLGVARHSETLEEFVVYRQEYGDHGLWVRPHPMFLEKVKVDGQEGPRFQLLQTEAESMQVAPQNLFHDLPLSLAQEQILTLLNVGEVRIERIVSHGDVSPEGFWFDQEQQEWVIVLQGAAKLRFEKDEKLVEMRPGDFIHIPAHRKHRVEWTAPNEPTIWLTVFFGAEGVSV